MGQVGRYAADKIHHLSTGGAEEVKKKKTTCHLLLCLDSGQVVILMT